MISRKLMIDADINCQIDGEEVRVRTDGHTLRVEVPDVATAVRLYRLSSPRGFHFGTFCKIQRLITHAAIRIELATSSGTLLTLRPRGSSSLGWLRSMPTFSLSAVPSIVREITKSR